MLFNKLLVKLKYSIFILLLNNGCNPKENLDKENVPVKQNPIQTPQIIIAENLGKDLQGRDTFVIEDIHFNRRPLLFQTNIKNASSYIWSIGSELILSNSFIRDFSNVKDGDYTVKLIVTYSDCEDCTKSKTRTDTITKQFKIISPCELLTNNSFRGIWEGEGKDSFTISIKNWNIGGNLTILDSCSLVSPTLIGFNKGININKAYMGDTIWLSLGNAYNSNTYLRMEWDGKNSPIGLLKVDPKKKTIRGTYTLDKKTHTFSGRLIN